MLEGSILQQLALAHSEKPLNFGVYYKNTLVALCHALEDCILQSSSPTSNYSLQRGNGIYKRQNAIKRWQNRQVKWRSWHPRYRLALNTPQANYLM
jgi:DICT domain-containing protein